MKISTRGQYGLEALIGLALKSTSTPVNLKSITSGAVYRNLYSGLFNVKAGILTSVRGAQGGTCCPGNHQISVRQVLEAVEGRWHLFLSLMTAMTHAADIKCVPPSVMGKS